MSKDSKTKRYKFDDYNNLCRAFYNKMLKLFETVDRPTNKEICKLTGASPTSVAKWFTGSQLPTVEQMYKLSNRFKVSIDWMIDNNPNIPSADYTKNSYYDVFQYLVSLISWKIIDTSVIQDPFLKYMVSEYLRLSWMPNLSRDKVIEWKQKLEKDYHFRLFTPDFIEVCYPFFSKAFVEVSEYDTYLAQIKALDEFRKYATEEGIDNPDDIVSVCLTWVQNHTDNNWE